MSKLEVREIGPISGETDLTLGQSGGTVTLADGATAVGFGSEAPEYPIGQVTAWVNFKGNGGVEIRDSINVSSITDEGVGVYTVNFATPFPDTNYICVGAQSPNGESHGSRSNVNTFCPDGQQKTTSSQGVDCRYVHGYSDPLVVHVAIIGN